MVRKKFKKGAMTLFPALTDTYYADNDLNLLKYMDYSYTKYIQVNQSFWSEADIDNRFKVGDQSLWGDIYGNLPAFRRKQFNFNRIRRTINMITGYQRQHRKSITVTPLESSSQQAADQYSKAIMWANQRGQVLETISEAFEGALTTGMNLLSVWMDYRGDPVSGDICVDNVSYNAYLIDPFFKKMDLSDCNSIWTRKYLSEKQVNALLPGREDEVNSLIKGNGNRDGKFQFMPEAYNYGMQDLMIYDEFWYLDNRKQTMLCDTITGETMEFRGKEEDLDEFVRLHPQVVAIDQQIPTVKLAIVVQGKVFYNGPNPMGTDKYPFVPVWAYYEPQVPYFPSRVQGVVRGLRDAQYLYNRRRIIELDILESQITSGFIYKENALVNPKDAFLSGQGRGLALKASAQMTDVQQIQPPAIPGSMIQLSELLAREIQEISGVNEELLGSAMDDKAGVLSMLRQGAGLTTLQVLFDNLDHAMKLLGKMEIELIQQNWCPGKIQRVVGEEPAPEFYNKAFGKYDSVVEEGLNTSTQKQMQFAQLLQLKEMGVPIPSQLLVEASTLQKKQELIDVLQQQESQQNQIQQQHAMAQIELLKAQIEDLKARATANEGLGMERASRIQENRALAVERLAEAEKDRDLGTLDRIKALKELEHLDLDKIHKIVSLLKEVEGDETKEEKAV